MRERVGFRISGLEFGVCGLGLREGTCRVYDLGRYHQRGQNGYILCHCG